AIDRGAHDEYGRARMGTGLLDAIRQYAAPEMGRLVLATVQKERCADQLLRRFRGHGPEAAFPFVFLPVRLAHIVRALYQVNFRHSGVSSSVQSVGRRRYTASLRASAVVISRKSSPFRLINAVATTSRSRCSRPRLSGKSSASSRSRCWFTRSPSAAKSSSRNWAS